MNYEELYEKVITREKDLNPIDKVVSSSDLEFAVHAKQPALIMKRERQPLYLNQWSMQQLSTKLGVPNSYLHKCPADLKETNVNYFLKANRQMFKLRLVKENNVRAVVSESFTPVDDRTLMDMVRPVFNKREELDILDYYQSDVMTSIRAVTKVNHGEEIQVGDIVKRGMVLNNSEVGYMAIQFRPLLYRLVCKNGMVAPKELGGFHFKHMGNIDRIMSASRNITKEMFSSLDGLIIRFRKTLEVEVFKPLEQIDEIVEENGWPIKWGETFKVAYSKEPSKSLFGVINALTRGGQLLDLPSRVEVEEYATSLIPRG